MNQHHHSKFFREMTALAVSMDVELEDKRLEVYWRIFEPYDWVDVQRAIAHAIRTCRFFPKPIELIEFIEGPASDAAEEAWLLLNEAWQEYGRRFSLRCEDPYMVEAILIAWNNWRDGATALQTAHEQGGAEAHDIHQTFVHAYRLALKRTVADHYLVGINEWLGEGWPGPVLVSRRQPPMLTPMPERQALSSEEFRQQDELDRRNEDALRRWNDSPEAKNWERYGTYFPADEQQRENV